MLKKGLGQELRRISHGPAIRHQHPLRFGLQLGRHRPELGHNVDRRCAFLCCAAHGRLSFPRLRGIDYDVLPIKSRAHHRCRAQGEHLVHRCLPKTLGTSR